VNVEQHIRVIGFIISWVCCVFRFYNASWISLYSCARGDQLVCEENFMCKIDLREW